jgi:hypothetical protein
VDVVKVAVATAAEAVVTVVEAVASVAMTAIAANQATYVHESTPLCGECFFVYLCGD